MFNWNNMRSVTKVSGKFGATVKFGLLDVVRSADGLFLGPTATFDFKDEASGEINPSRYFRKNLDLFANVRPAPDIAGRDIANPASLILSAALLLAWHSNFIDSGEKAPSPP
jgi:isocitrate/isopropylmalate dehydrogenase